jgi:long-chain fatty acid transport protein
MKKHLWFFYVTVLLVLAVFASNGSANSIFSMPGTRAAAMGDAFVAVADDLSAIYFNPAGLTQLKNRNVELAFSYSALKATANKSLANSITPNSEDGDFPIFNLYGLLGTLTSNPALMSAEPDFYNSTELKSNGLLPFVATNFKIKDNTIAIGFYAVGGGGGKWEDTVTNAFNDTITASAEESMGMTITNVSAARQLNDKLSLGLGVNYINMFDKIRVLKSFSQDAASPFGSYGMLVDFNSSGSALEIFTGILYEINKDIKAGLTFKSGATIKIKGKGTLIATGMDTITGGALAPYGIADTNMETNYTQNYAYPMTCALGCSYKPKENLLLAFSAEQVFYSQLRNEMTFDTENPLAFVNENSDAKWINVIYLRIGAEYLLNDKLTLRTGFQVDPNQVNTGNYTLLSTFQYEMYTWGLGAGYNLGNFKFDGTVESVFSKTAVKADREYKFPSTSFRLSAGYMF